jgi:arylsulfatase
VTDRIPRDALPIPDRPYQGELPLDAKDPSATFPPTEPLRPPTGAVPMIFSADETTDVGSNTASPVSDDYGPTDNAFNGRVEWVQIGLGADAEDADHLISPEERLRVAMARQ